MSDAKPLTMTTNVTAAGSSYIYNLNVIKRTKIEVTGITAGAWTANGTTTGDITPIPYVTFKAKAEQKFKMTTKDYSISGLEYSVNGCDWKDVEADTEVPFGGENGTLRLRGTNINGTATGVSQYSTIKFTVANVNVACTGDIRTLLDWKKYTTVDTPNAKFCYLFKDCVALTSAPALPATNLAEKCYASMFKGCTNLETAPALPATYLAGYCYYYMFAGCKKLNTAPELPATHLTLLCYYGMFEGCSSLQKTPGLSAIGLQFYCYAYMFNGCTNLTSVTMLAPSDQISGDYFTDWLKNAGTKEGITRTLKVKEPSAYNKLKDEGVLPTDYWLRGKCMVEW